jgi:hypothetical protein
MYWNPRLKSLQLTFCSQLDGDKEYLLGKGASCWIGKQHTTYTCVADIHRCALPLETEC